MNENEFWVKFWKIIAVCFCVVVTTIGGCNVYEMNKIAEMVSRGETPLAASCAFRSEEHTSELQSH